MKKNLIFAGLGLAGTCISVNALPENGRILESSLAGSWYEANPVRLRSQLRQWVQTARLPEKMPSAPPCALILPHAGYAYAGPIAAFGCKVLAGRHYDRVLILGPSHRVYLPDQLCIPAADGFRTPLGTVPTDREALRLLGEQSWVRTDDRIHIGEHSVQIQLPYLQYALTAPFQVVPVIVGSMTPEAVRRAASLLASLLTPSTLVVVSSDFTHFGQDFGYVPFRENIAENLRKLDMGAFEQIRTGDAGKFARYLEKTGATICGEAPIRILLEMMPHKPEITLLHYANSADGGGDYSHCVSYLSALVSADRAVPEKTDADSVIPEKDRRVLLKTARDSIEYVFRNRRLTPPDQFADRASACTSVKMGCFVTLKIGDDLRGCIGEIEPFRPLYQAVTGRAADAAFRDPRFPQLTPAELPRVEIEISALTPAKPVATWREIEIGRHGMTIEKNGRSAVFLPQVATEQGWTLEETLTYLSRKAGLPADAWKSPEAKFTVFEAIVFKESEFRETGR